MPEEIPLWAFLVSHAVTIAGGGGLGAWLSGRGKSKEGDAAVTDARTKADSALWARMDAEIERLDRKLDKERQECDERIEALEREVGELETTVAILVRHYDDISEPLPVEVDP